MTVLVNNSGFKQEESLHPANHGVFPKDGLRGYNSDFPSTVWLLTKAWDTGLRSELLKVPSCFAVHSWHSPTELMDCLKIENRASGYLMVSIFVSLCTCKVCWVWNSPCSALYVIVCIYTHTLSHLNLHILSHLNHAGFVCGPRWCLVRMPIL